MKQYSKKLFSIAMLLSTAAITANTPFLQFRSQGRNTARKVVGETVYATDLYDFDAWYGVFDITLEYDRSFRPQSITNALFCPDVIKSPNINGDDTTNNHCTTTCGDHGRAIIVSGSELENRNAATDWMAENFFLPTNFQSILTFSPLVQNVIVNFDWFMGLDRWCSGLYFRLYGPVVNNRTNLRLKERVVTPGSNAADDLNFQPGFVNVDGITVDDLFPRATNFFAGESLDLGEDTTFIPLRFAKMSPCKRSKTGFAELRGEFGWNYLRDRYRVGLNIQAAAPTGTRPKANWVLEPQVGNGKHWELGVGLKGLWSFWYSEDEEKHFDFLVEADITHLFKAKQRRTFDLVGKPNSRYMLAQQLEASGDTNPRLDETSDPQQVQFSGTFSPVANFSTRNVKVSIGVQGDVVAMFTYAMRGFTWDLGYNFWGMSCEKIHVSCSNSTSSCHNTCTTGTTNNNIIMPFPENTWALKGDASIAGELATNEVVFLAATESMATIHVGTNGLDDAGVIDPTNAGIDNPTPALAIFNGTSGQVVNVIGLTPAEAINTSNPAVFIKAADLDINGARMRGFSNKIFTHFGYTWNNCCDRWIPFVGIGASGEFGSHKSCHRDCPDDTTRTRTTNFCTSSGGGCNKFALSQWAVWIKGGVSFH